jgi:lysophospholipase L1-like esterase
MRPMSWRSFVALGDSFTEGLDDPDPDGPGYRGWADLVAQRLATEAAVRGAELHYANLAVRGRLFAGVVERQLPAALSMRPDLVSFAAGGNDVLRRGFDGPALVARYGEVVAGLQATGAEVILFRFADLTRRLPARRVVLPRATILGDATADIARRHGAHLVDLWADDELATNGLMWSEDRLHLSTAGHRRVAGHVLRVLGVDPDPDSRPAAAVGVLRDPGDQDILVRVVDERRHPRDAPAGVLDGSLMIHTTSGKLWPQGVPETTTSRKL